MGRTHSSSSFWPTVAFPSGLEEAFYYIGDSDTVAVFDQPIVFLSRLEEAFYDIGDSDTQSFFFCSLQT